MCLTDTIPLRILRIRCDFITERTVLPTATPLRGSGPVKRARRE